MADVQDFYCLFLDPVRGDVREPGEDEIACGLHTSWTSFIGHLLQGADAVVEFVHGAMGEEGVMFAEVEVDVLKILCCLGEPADVHQGRIIF